MQRCKTCRHWAKPKSEYGEVPGSGNCEAIPQLWDASEWDENGSGRVPKAQYADKRAFLQDGSDYMAVLKTLPDFGCVHHEPVAEPADQPEL